MAQGPQLPSGTSLDEHNCASGFNTTTPAPFSYIYEHRDSEFTNKDESWFPWDHCGWLIISIFHAGIDSLRKRESRHIWNSFFSSVPSVFRLCCRVHISARRGKHSFQGAGVNSFFLISWKRSPAGPLFNSVSEAACSDSLLDGWSCRHTPNAERRRTAPHLSTL